MPDKQRKQLIEDCCILMHNAYETAAKETGWKTQKKSRKKWEEIPEANKETMRIAVSAVIDFLSERLMHHNHKSIDMMPDA